MTDNEDARAEASARPPLSERLAERDATLDTMALVQDLDRQGFDFESYIMPDTADGGQTIIDTFRQHRAALSDDQLRELSELVLDQRHRQLTRGGDS